MVPSLAPGDRLVVRSVRRPQKRMIGKIVVARDPRNDKVLVIKRLVDYDEHSFELRGDNALASTDSRVIGRFPNRLLEGEVVFRYFPIASAGKVM